MHVPIDNKKELKKQGPHLIPPEAQKHVFTAHAGAQRATTPFRPSQPPGKREKQRVSPQKLSGSCAHTYPSIIIKKKKIGPTFDTTRGPKARFHCSPGGAEGNNAISPLSATRQTRKTKSQPPKPLGELRVHVPIDNNKEKKIGPTFDTTRGPKASFHCSSDWVDGNNARKLH